MNEVPVPEDKEAVALPQRLSDQIAFYEQRANQAWRRHSFLRTVQILLSFAIPVASSVITDQWWLKVVPIILGSALAATEAFRQLYKADQHFQRWRLAAERLKREKYLYLQKSGDYKYDNAAAQLAERVEALIEEERNEWILLERSSSSTIDPTDNQKSSRRAS